MVLILIDWPCWLRVNLSGHHVNMVFSGGPGSGVISPLGRAICAVKADRARGQRRGFHPHQPTKPL